MPIRAYDPPLRPLKSRDCTPQEKLPFFVFRLKLSLRFVLNVFRFSAFSVGVLVFLAFRIGNFTLCSFALCASRILYLRSWTWMDVSLKLFVFRLFTFSYSSSPFLPLQPSSGSPPSPLTSITNLHHTSYIIHIIHIIQYRPISIYYILYTLHHIGIMML
ncbi:hypothetical protein BDN71DRAFT_519161 [Pleurotus eryngii]|uniref:Transmembrane protein n=1 Tax=Pleurotus eryngii TaxID=5323 RepID=A0A9P5ZJB9_PLEER|nr:hypothetical protein BDN71DRAFT_519161 [Pleurotus eryngii]